MSPSKPAASPAKPAATTVQPPALKNASEAASRKMHLNRTLGLSAIIAAGAALIAGIGAGAMMMRKTAEPPPPPPPAPKGRKAKG